MFYFYTNQTWAKFGKATSKICPDIPISQENVSVSFILKVQALGMQLY